MATTEDILAEWRVRNARQIDAAVNLLTPNSREDVEMELIEAAFVIEQSRAHLRERTKEAKRATAKVSSDAERLLRSLSDPNAPFELAMFFPRQTIEEWAARAKEIATTPSGNMPRFDTEARREAVRSAYALICKYGSEELKAISKSETFPKLAAILYGKPTADLTSLCRALLRKARG